MDIELEPEKIAELRERLEGISLDAFDQRDVNRVREDDKYAQCFIQWRKGDMELAFKLVQDVLKWRKEKEVYDLKPEDFPAEIIGKGIIYAHGKAKDGTIIVHFITRHQTKDMKAQVQKLLTLWLERVQQAYPGHHMTFLLDVSKSSLLNVDLGGIRFMLDCFTTHFPGMLERIIILEMPWIMNAIWKVVKQWMTEDQRKRTVFASFKELKQHIDPDQLSPYLGGTDNWQYSYPPFPEEIPDVKYPTGDESFFEECEVTEAIDDSIPNEEVTVDDLEITATSQLPMPQDSSSFIVEEQPPAMSPEPEQNMNANMNQREIESPSKQPNGDVNFVQEKEIGVEPKPSTSESKPAIVVSKSKEDVAKGKQAQTDEDDIKLGHLLAMSPASEVSFSDEKKDKNSGRYQSSICLKSITTDDSSVTFKVKTTSPERYHVKPSTGKIQPGEKTTIRISLSPGNEDKVVKDRFLILYQTIQNDEDVAAFWKEHTSKNSRNEYRVRVKFNQKSLDLSPQVSSLALPPKTHSSHSTVNLPNSKSPLQNDRFARLNREISSLRRQFQVSEEKSELWRSRFRISMILQIFLLLLLLYALHKLSAIGAAIEIVLYLVLMPFRLFRGPSYLGGLPTDRPLIIAHRGSCGMLPEHTAEAYKLAIEQGADIIECDLAITKDLKLLCVHDAYLSNVTDVKSHPEFQDRVTTRLYKGENVTDYFAVDFTFDEIMTLRSIQRFPFRDQSYNGKFPLTSFDDYVTIAKNASNSRTVGIYPETKNPEFYNPILKDRGANTTMEDLLLSSLRHHGYVTKDAPCLIQSFSSSSLLYMSSRTPLPLIQLTKVDFNETELVGIAEICYGLGADKSLMVEVDDRNKIKGETDFIKRAHAVGLKVHGFVFRDEYIFLAWNYGQDGYREYQLFIGMGIDGLFTDFAWSLSNYMQHFD